MLRFGVTLLYGTALISRISALVLQSHPTLPLEYPATDTALVNSTHDITVHDTILESNIDWRLDKHLQSIVQKEIKKIRKPYGGNVGDAPRLQSLAIALEGWQSPCIRLNLKWFGRYEDAARSRPVRDRTPDPDNRMWNIRRILPLKSGRPSTEITQVHGPFDVSDWPDLFEFSSQSVPTSYGDILRICDAEHLPTTYVTHVIGFPSKELRKHKPFIQDKPYWRITCLLDRYTIDMQANNGHGALVLREHNPHFSWRIMSLLLGAISLPAIALIWVIP